MRTRILLVCLLLVCGGSSMRSQITGDVIGQHSLGPGSPSPITGAASGSCIYCHAPHSGLDSGNLWNQKLTIQTYTSYTSSTYSQKGNNQPVAGTDTNLCLSCHDGTVAVGMTVVYGKIATMGAMRPTDIVGTLQSSHPVSLVLPLKDASDLVASLTSSGKTADSTGAVKLINGNIECTSCHNPHVEAKDKVAKQFLAKDSSSGALCLACHDPNRQPSGNQGPNGLAGWPQSIHATSNVSVQNLPYSNLSQNACLSCHTDHNAGGAEWLQRGAGDQVCLNCHSATGPATPSAANRGAPLPPRVTVAANLVAQLNVESEYAKIGHPIATVNMPVQSGPANREQGRLRNAAPDSPNQTGCIDCHDPHAVQAQTTFSAAPALRPSQAGMSGMSATDGTKVVRPAVEQFQTCLRCHGTTSVKTASPKFGYLPARQLSGDPLNVIPQFNSAATSSHPVMRDRSSPLPQPSLLPHMLNLNGTTQGRSMGTRIFCSDCHNSDDNREFGGTGPSGPHGSKWTHILERRYEMNQAPAPGQRVTNLLSNPDLSANGPYAMCAKCHDLSSIMRNASFAGHEKHVSAGFSCSTCHSAHGVGAASANLGGQRLLNFDLNVVGPNGGAPITYNRGTATCTLTCHQAAHESSGKVTLLTGGLGVKK